MWKAREIALSQCVFGHDGSIPLLSPRVGKASGSHSKCDTTKVMEVKILSRLQGLICTLSTNVLISQSIVLCVHFG